MLDHLLRIMGSHLPQWQLSGQEQFWLLSARDHNALLATRRARIIATRVRVLAGLFIALTPIWVLVEYLTLPLEIWLALAAARLAVIVAFSGLLVALAREGSRPAASKVSLFGLFFVPAVFYVAATLLLGQGQFAGMAQAVVATHTFFPVLLVAGISLFPLTAAESLALIAPVFAARAWMMWQVLAPDQTFALLGALWFLILVAGVGVLAAVSQLSFIIVLLRQAIRDPLTGAFSRAAGDELLELEFTIAQRNDTPFSLAFIDLDRFKEVNDVFGHETGDRVLAQAAASIASALRATDILVRWGGEEFLVILPNTRCPQAMVGLERLRLAGFGLRPSGEAQTASIGVAERVTDGRETASRLVDLADERMYQAKAGGRNRLVGCVPPYDASGAIA